MPRVRVGLVGLVGLVGGVVASMGCRGAVTTEPAQPVAAVVSGEESRPAEADPPAEATPPAEAEPPDEATPPIEAAPPLQSIVPIAVPFPEGAVVVQAVDDQLPVVLFEDETVSIRRRVGRVLAAHDHPVVPVEQLEAIEADAAAGRLRLEDDQICRAPLTRAEVWDRYFAASPRATVEAECYDDCSLQVFVDDPPGSSDPSSDSSRPMTFASRTVARPYDPRSWARAKLRPVESMSGGGFGTGMGSSHPPPIMFGVPIPIGPWAPEPTGERLDALEPEVARCAHPDPLAGFSYEVRMAVDASGRVARCSARSEHSLARASDAACLCTGIEAVRYPKGKAGRRLRVKAIDEGGHGPAGVRLQARQPGTEPWVRRLEEATALARCTSKSRPEDGFEATLVLQLEPDGAVTRVKVFGDVDTMLRVRFASCLAEELRSVPLPCRPPGIDTLQVTVAVGGK